MASTLDRNKNRTRPRKSVADKERRVKQHRERLIALGVPKEEVTKMDARKVRILLRHPKKIAAKKAKKS